MPTRGDQITKKQKRLIAEIEQLLDLVGWNPRTTDPFAPRSWNQFFGALPEASSLTGTRWSMNFSPIKFAGSISEGSEHSSSCGGRNPSEYLTITSFRTCTH